MSIELMKMLTASGVEVVPVETDSAEPHLIGEHWNAIKHFLHTGDISVFAPFASGSVQGRYFAIDPDWIERWAARGELDFEDIYENGGW